MVKSNKLAYSIGCVSLFYWFSVWLIPTYRLVGPSGTPINGLGLIVYIFDDTVLSLAVMTVSLLYILALKFRWTRVHMITVSLLFGLWCMSTMAYIFWACTHHFVAPNLAIHAGYCYAIWLCLKGCDDV